MTTRCWIGSLVLLALLWSGTHLFAQDKDKKKKPKLFSKEWKEKVVDDAIDALSKAAAKKMRYNKNWRTGGGISASETWGRGRGGDYDDILVKDSAGVYRHLDGRPATAEEIKKFKKKYKKEKSILPDRTFFKWNTAGGTDPKFSHTLFDKPYGRMTATGLKLHATLDARTGKFTLRDQFGYVHEGLGVRASAVTTFTLIDIRGESKTIKFDKGDFHLRSKLVAALNSHLYASASTANVATLNGLYSVNTAGMGIRTSARVSLPTDFEYKRIRVTVTPYVGVSNYAGVSGRMDYGMDWGGATRNSWSYGGSTGASWEAGVTVSISIKDAAKMTKGFIKKLTGLGR